VLTATDIRATAIARGRAIKRVNAFTAILCGGLPAILLGLIFPFGLRTWLGGFVIGLLWANWFEYAYHRFLLHLHGTFFARRHLGHHATVGMPTEAEHVNLGSSPAWVVALFAIDGLPVVVAALLFRLGRALRGQLEGRLADRIFFLAGQVTNIIFGEQEAGLTDVRVPRDFRLVEPARFTQHP